MQDQDRAIVSKVLGFFSVVVYWIIAGGTLAMFSYQDYFGIITFIFYLVIPVIVFIKVRKNSKIDPTKRAFYKGMKLGFIVSLVFLIIGPLIVLGSCFVLMGSVI